MNRNKTFSHRRWVFTLLFLVVSAIGLVVLVNAITDPYAVLRSDRSLHYQEPNQRFLKIRHLLAQKDRYDSFLFGSSRALHIDTRAIRDGKYYNLGTSEGIPQEHLQHIEFLLQNGIRVRNVLVALDDFSYRLYPEQHLNDLLRQPHYRVSGKPWPQFYAEYLVRSKRFFPTIRDYWKANYTKAGRAAAERHVYDILGTGCLFCAECDREIDLHPAAHDRDPRFLRPMIYYSENNMESTLASLKALVELARKDNIHLTFFINPIHRTSYLGTNLPLFFEFKRRLAELTGYWDFSGLNSITTNNYYFYESSHFRDRVGDMMLSRMFGYPKVRVPGDFGDYVTSDTVEAHIRAQRAEIAKARANVGAAVPGEATFRLKQTADRAILDLQSTGARSCPKNP